MRTAVPAPRAPLALAVRVAARRGRHPRRHAARPGASTPVDLLRRRPATASGGDVMVEDFGADADPRTATALRRAVHLPRPPALLPDLDAASPTSIHESELPAAVGSLHPAPGQPGRRRATPVVLAAPGVEPRRPRPRSPGRLADLLERHGRTRHAGLRRRRRLRARRSCSRPASRWPSGSAMAGLAAGRPRAGCSRPPTLLALAGARRGRRR